MVCFFEEYSIIFSFYSFSCIFNILNLLIYTIIYSYLQFFFLAFLFLALSFSHSTLGIWPSSFEQYVCPKYWECPVFLFWGWPHFLHVYTSLTFLGDGRPCAFASLVCCCRASAFLLLSAVVCGTEI